MTPAPLERTSPAEQPSRQLAGAAGGPEAPGPACNAQIFICSTGKEEIHILYRSLLWEAESYICYERSWKRGKGRKMATIEKK